MKKQQSSAVRLGGQGRREAVVRPGGEALWLKGLAVLSLVLLAAALTVRPILGEMATVQVTQLLSPSPLWWNSSPAVMYIAHVLAAGGVLAGVLWVVWRGRRWRFTGLEPAVGLLVVAAVVSIPGASDKRLAINVAIGTILPMAGAAVLAQLLGGREAWRRVVLAAIVAAAVANCWRATRQQVIEYEDTWQYYVEHKADYWAKQGKGLDDPVVAIFEARIKAHQPSGYFYHPNVMASFLLLGIGAAGAGLAGAGFSLRRLRRGQKREAERPEGSLPAATAETRGPGARAAERGEAAPGVRVFWSLGSGMGLVAVIVWSLVVIYWVGSVGARAGLVLGGATAGIVWGLRRRPRAAWVLVLAMLAGLQISLVVLAARADRVVPSLVERGGKMKSLAFRLDYWHGAMELFAQHPIAGVGPGQFGRYYPSVKPIRAAEEVVHPHNWLLGTAAEWGTLGLVGTVVGLVLPAWLMLRRRETGATTARSLSAGAGLDGWVLVLAWVVVVLCWLVFLPGVVPAGSAVFLVETVPAVPFALAGAALASLAAGRGRAGAIVLGAALAGFFVHATVEMSSGVAGATWPFWAVVALALTWESDPAWEESAQAAGWRGLGRPAFVSAGLGVAAVLGLSYGPIVAVWSMSQAKNALESASPVRAEAPLLAAAAADSLDPAPRAALGELYRRMAHANRKQAAGYLRKAVTFAQAAVQRDPRDHTLWHDLAWTSAELAAVTQDAAAVRQTLAAMRQAVELYPNWPRGHFKYAVLLAGAGEPSDYRPDLLRQALAEFDTALRLDEQWPGEDPNKFDEQDLSDLRGRRQRTVEKLGNPPASQGAGTAG